MKPLYSFLALLSLMLSWPANAAQLTGAKLTIGTPDGDLTIALPGEGFPVADYTAMGAAPSLVVKTFEVAATGDVADVTLMVALYEQGGAPEEWIQIPLANNGNDSWIANINKDLVEEGPGKFTLEIYVVGHDNEQNQLMLNNGGQNYIVKFELGAAEDHTVHWLKTGTADIILATSEDYLEYRYNGDGTRDNTTMPGGVDMLAINYFNIYYDLEEGTEIVDASLQYMIYPDGEEGSGWNGIACNELNTLVSERHNTYRSSFNEQRLITRDLAPGNYVLRIMFQLIDNKGEYHFFGKEDYSNFVFYFSVNEPKDPDITGISMVVTPTPGEQQYPWFEKGVYFEPVDWTNEAPVQSLTVDEFFIFTEGNFEEVYLTGKFIDAVDRNEICGVIIPAQLDDFGNWSFEGPLEVLKRDILEDGKTYNIEFWAEGIANGEKYRLDNDEQNYRVTFVYGSNSQVRGDINGDSIVDVSDLALLIDVVLGNRPIDDPEVKGDVHVAGNDSVDVADIAALIDLVLGK